MIDEIVTATDKALRRVVEPRFFLTERGFHGRFYCALQQALEERDLLPDGRILEMEYQKSGRHDTDQRPDIVLHVPAEESRAEVYENNFAVWALKRKATQKKARCDFCKLDEMFARLFYRVGVFINIDARDHFAAAYNGNFPDRLRTVAVWRERDGEIVTKWGPEQARRNDRPTGQA